MQGPPANVELSALRLQVDKDLRQMLIREDAPPATKIGVRVWPKAIPQFNVGHLEVVQVRPCMHALKSGHPHSTLCQAELTTCTMPLFGNASSDTVCPKERLNVYCCQAS